MNHKQRITNRERKTGGRQLAFTLIELLMVMVVAVVIMTVSLPAFISLGRGAGMRTAVNNVRSTLALSRQWAITHREVITFVAATNCSTNWIRDINPTNDFACFYATNNFNITNQSVTLLPLDVEFENPAHITFETCGGLNGTASTNVVLRDKKNKTIKQTISINRFTGGIRLE